MPRTRLIALNGNAGAFVSVLASIPCRYVEIREDEAAAATGLQYQQPDDNFTQTYVVGTPGSDDDAQIKLGNKVAIGNDAGSILGWPSRTIGGDAPGTVQAATTLIKLRGNGAGGTNVRVTEYE